MLESYKASNGSAMSNVATVVLGIGSGSGKGNGSAISSDDHDITDDQAPAWRPEQDLHGLYGLSGPGYHGHVVDYFVI